MNRISLVMPYYENPGMLASHYADWSALPADIADRLQIVIVDDGSPSAHAVDVPRPAGLPALAIYRVTIDKPWHQHAARNIGAHEAVSSWLLLTDMDHAVPQQTWRALFGRNDRGKVYTFGRVDAPDMTPKLHPVTGQPHPHPNSFAMTKDLYWRVGGYDEDFCGIYGTDGLFRSRLFAIAPEVKLSVPLVRFDRSLISDAATRTLPRKEGRPAGAKQEIRDRKRAAGTLDTPKVLSMPYVKVFP